MIAVTNRLYVSPSYVAEFEERFRNRSGLVESMEGFVRNQVWRPEKEGEPYVVMTIWESRAHFEAWVKSDAFKQAHTGDFPRDAYTARNHVEVYEVLMETVAGEQ